VPAPNTAVSGSRWCRGELPQIRIRRVQSGQVAVIARQPRFGLRNRRPQPIPPDLLAPNQTTDLLIGDLRVGDDRQQLVQQRLPVLAGLATFGQLVAHPPLGRAELRRDRLVEHLDHLVEHVGGRLCQHHEQDRVAAGPPRPAAPPTHRPARTPTTAGCTTSPPAQPHHRAAALRSDERHVRRGEREVPEQLSRLISGNSRRRCNSSSANTRVATNPSLHPRRSTSSATKPSTNDHRPRPNYGITLDQGISRTSLFLARLLPEPQAAPTAPHEAPEDTGTPSATMAGCSDGSPAPD
jgi:hypothetical protein